jgi:hypothetical protein
MEHVDDETMIDREDVKELNMGSIPYRGKAAGEWR